MAKVLPQLTKGLRAFIQGLDAYLRDNNVASIDGLPTPLTPSGVA